MKKTAQDLLQEINKIVTEWENGEGECGDQMERISRIFMDNDIEQVK